MCYFYLLFIHNIFIFYLSMRCRSSGWVDWIFPSPPRFKYYWDMCSSSHYVDNIVKLGLLRNRVCIGYHPWNEGKYLGFFPWNCFTEKKSKYLFFTYYLFIIIFTFIFIYNYIYIYMMRRRRTMVMMKMLMMMMMDDKKKCWGWWWWCPRSSSRVKPIWLFGRCGCTLW